MSDVPEVEFDYNLVGSGWSEALFVVGEARVGLTASYLEDALGDLLGALLRIALGDKAAKCAWEEEPGEYRWLFTRTGSRLRIQVLAFDDVYDQSPDENGRLLFDEESEVRTVVEAVVAGAERVVAKHGERGYREKWVDHDFPADELQQLKQFIGTA